MKENRDIKKTKRLRNAEKCCGEYGNICYYGKQVIKSIEIWHMSARKVYRKTKIIYHL